MMKKRSSRPRSAFKLLKSMTKCCNDFASMDFISLTDLELGQFKPETVLGWLLAKHGLGILGLLQAVQKLLPSLTRQQRLDTHGFCGRELYSEAVAKLSRR